MAKILVSLVSDQTLPNVELIKEFQEHIDKFVFITTDKMRKQYDWILKTTKIGNFDEIPINPFDKNDIEQKLTEYNFGDDEIIVNITGGTKLTLIIVTDFFRNIGATIYYVTGYNKEYLKVFPNRGKQKFVFEKPITLREYLTAYGFEYADNNYYKDLPQAERIYDYFMQHQMNELKEIIEPIRLRRGKKMPASDINIINFLKEIQYPNFEKLSEKDTKYLSGDWLEEYVYHKIKMELNLCDDEISTGIALTKENTPNEIDVIFIYNHVLYVVECKTSVIEIRNVKQFKEGKEVEISKEIKLLGEITYKSDALRNNFGLFSNTSILTLEELKNEDGTPKPGYETHFDRIKLSRINLISKRDFLSGKTIKELLKIQ